MPSLNDFVSIILKKGTKTVPLPAFGIPAILGPSNRIGSDVFRSYTDPADMLTDSFLTSDPEYKHAALLMSQSVKPEKFLIGKYTTPVAQVETVSITTVADTTLYRVTINGTNCDYTSDGTATGAEIQAGLVAAINASVQASVVTAAPGAGTSVTITSDEAGLGFSIAVGANLSVAHTTPNHSIVDDIKTLQASNDTGWYCLLVTSKLKADILQIAAYIETQLKFYAAATVDADVLTTATDDVASKAKGKNYARSFIFYSGEAVAGADAAWVGRVLPTKIGSATWADKTLVGVDADDLSETQYSNAKGKNANVYVTVGGVDITTYGVTPSGEYIDITIGDDWLASTMQANVFQKIVNNDKLPFTNKGIGAVELGVREALQEGVDRTFLADDPKFTVSVPDALAVSDTDRQNRVLNGVEFQARHAGAIQKVKIQGFLSV